MGNELSTEPTPAPNLPPVFSAVRNGDLDGLVEHLSSGIRVNETFFDGMSLLFFASSSGHLHLVKYLISKGAVVNFQDHAESVTPLYNAARFGYLDVVSYLHSCGGDVNLPINLGTPPLWPACFEGHQDVVQFLLDHGAAVDVLDQTGGAPIFAAAYKGELEIVKMLAKKGDVNLRRNRARIRCQSKKVGCD